MSVAIHLCIITSAHPVDDVRVNHKLGQAFRASGFQVTWVGPDHAFADYKNYNRYDIQYKLFRCGNGKVGRILNVFKLYWHALRVPNVDVFYIPDPDAAIMAIRLLRKAKARIIFDIHEIYHGVMLDRWVQGGPAKIISRILHHEISYTCSKCDLVMGVGNSYLESYEGAIKEKLVVRSCAPSWFAKDPPADVCGTDRKAFVFFHGKANLSRGTSVILKALAVVKKSYPDIKCVMFDSFVDSVAELDLFQQQVTKLNLKEVVELREVIPMQEMPAILRSCDAGLIAYNREFGVESLPNRFFEYMAAGLPIIVPNYSQEMYPVIESEQCGVGVDFEDPSLVANAMLWFCQNPEKVREMGLKSRIAFEQRHNWETEVQPLIDRIQSWFVKPDFFALD